MCRYAELEDKMPVNDYSEYFGPTHTLQISPSNMVGLHSCASHLTRSLKAPGISTLEHVQCFFNPLEHIQ